MSATLSAQRPGARIVAREALPMIQCPNGTWSHKPVPHAELVEVLTTKLYDRGWGIAREQFAVSENGMKLFGALDLIRSDGVAGVEGTCTALGFRAANDKSLAIRLVAGARVFVCDNLALSGSSIVLSRKHTRSLSLAYEVNQALEYFGSYVTDFEQSVVRAQEYRLDDAKAKAIVFDLFYGGILPVSLFSEMTRNYFKADTYGFEDCQARTLWGLHNAGTRAIKALTPLSGFEATQRLGQAIGLGNVAGIVA